jgi:hypothetical protein
LGDFENKKKKALKTYFIEHDGLSREMIKKPHADTNLTRT